VEKALHGLFPLERHPKKPRFLAGAGRRIVRRQTISTSLLTAFVSMRGIAFPAPAL
jgi:hypothetical protein